jgi:uroporphyrin-III C-methyltransferase
MIPPGWIPDRIHWEGIAKGSPVIVMYMAMKHIGQIAANLMCRRPLAG